MPGLRPVFGDRLGGRCPSGRSPGDVSCEQEPGQQLAPRGPPADIDGRRDPRRWIGAIGLIGLSNMA
jgi:hypothetical protein